MQIVLDTGKLTIKIQRNFIELEVGSQAQLTNQELKTGKGPGTEAVFLSTQELLHTLGLLEGQFFL